MRSKRTDITQAGIIMCKHTASHQHIAQSQGLLRPTRTERSSHQNSAPKWPAPCGGQAISKTPRQSAKTARTSKASPQAGAARGAQLRRGERKNGQTRALVERALVPPTPHPPAPLGFRRAPCHSPPSGRQDRFPMPATPPTAPKWLMLCLAGNFQGPRRRTGLRSKSSPGGGNGGLRGGRGVSRSSVRL